MKILLINDKFGEFGGTEEYINSFIRAFSSLGYKIGIAYGKKYPPDFKNPWIECECPLPFLNFRNFNLYPDYKRDLQKLKEFILWFKPDITYIHNVLDYRIIEAIPKKKAGKIVWYCHDHYFYCLTELKLFEEKPCEFTLSERCIEHIKAGKCLLRYPLSQPPEVLYQERQKLLNSVYLFDHVIVISEYMKKTLLQNLPLLKNIRVVPRQVEIPEKVERTFKFVLFAGRLVKEKGVHHAIEAMRFIKNSSLVIVGQGDDKAYIEKCKNLAKEVERNSSVKIKFAGFVSHDKIGEFYRGAMMVLVPSLFPEPFGMVAAESLAHGVPVVAYNSGGLNSTVINGKTGFLVEHGNINQLAEKTKFLLENLEKNKKIGLSGRKWILERFTLEKHIKSLKEIFED